MSSPQPLFHLSAQHGPHPLPKRLSCVLVLVINQPTILVQSALPYFLTVGNGARGRLIILVHSGRQDVAYADNSMSIGLGMSGTVERYVRGPNGSQLEGYRAAFYFGTGLAGLAVFVVGVFVRMPKQAQYRE